MMNAMPLEGADQSGLVSAKLVVDLLCFLTAPLLLFYGARSYFNGFEAYGLSLYAFSAAVVTSFCAYKFFGHWRAHRNFLVFTFTIFYFYLLISGGESGTGIFWLYAYPLLVFSVLGLRAGALVMSAMMSATVCILTIPGWLQLDLIYSTSTKLRFIGSMLFVTIMAYTMERARVSAAIAHARLSRALEDLARTDELTGLLNRRGMSERIDAELARTVRDNQEMSVVICDVDFFKKINDRYGHDVGDEVLVSLADKLKETVRGSDSVGRWGGEEFIVLLPNTCIEQAFVLIERIRQSIAAEAFRLGQRSLDISISCGLSSTKFSTEYSGLLKAADISLYEAKNEGRNCTRPQVLKAS
jgi:diguanylate cyclase (GGDEF)-like protein